MAFDPDAYLAGGTATADFNPDAYLGIEQKKQEFNPDEYLGAPPAGAPVALVPPEAQQALGTSAQAAFGVAGPVAAPVTTTPVADLLQMQRLPEAAAAAQTELAPQFDQYQVAQPDLQAIAMAQGAAMQPEAPPPETWGEAMKRQMPGLQQYADYPKVTDPDYAARQQADAWIFNPEKVTTVIDYLRKRYESNPALSKATAATLPGLQPYADYPKITDKDYAARQKNQTERALNALSELPQNFADFATSETGLYLAPVVELGAVPRLALALGFTGDQIKAFAQAGTLEEKVKAAAGIALTIAAGGKEGVGIAKKIEATKKARAYEAAKAAGAPGVTPTIPGIESVLPETIAKGGELISEQRKAIEQQQQQAAGAIQQQAAVQAIQGRAEGGPGGAQEIARGGGPGIQGPEGAPGRAAETGAGGLAPEDRRGPGSGPVGEPAAGLPPGGGPGAAGGYGYPPTGEPIITAEPVTGAPVPPVIPAAPKIEYLTPEAEAWWSKAAELKAAYHATARHSPERAAARQAFIEHANQVQGTGNKLSRYVNGKEESAIHLSLAKPEAPPAKPTGAPAPPVIPEIPAPTVPARPPEFWRGGGEGAPPKGKTAADIVDYETTELGNKIAVTPGIDLSKIPAEQTQWVSPTQKAAEQFGEAERIPGNFQVIGKDPEGGILIYKPRSAPVVSIAEPRPPTAAEKGKMYKTSKWTDVVEINSAQGNKIGKVNGNITDAGFEIKGANIIPGERGKGHYPEVLRQLAEKYGRVTSDPDGLSKAAEAAWKKVPGATKQGNVYTLEGPKTPEQMRAEAASAAAVAPSYSELAELRKAGNIANAQQALADAKSGREPPSPFTNGFKAKAPLVRARVADLEAAQSKSAERHIDPWNEIMDASRQGQPIHTSLVEALDSRQTAADVPSTRDQAIENLQNKGYVREGDIYRAAPPVPAAVPAAPPPITAAMGAASIHEPLARYEMRGFAEKVQADNTVAQAVRDAVGNRYYEPIPNVQTAAEAEALVAQRGPLESIKIITDQTNGLEYRHRVTMGMNVMRKLNAEYERLKDTNPAAADKILDAQAALTESVQELGTGLGQGLQAFRMWTAMGPDGKLRALENQIRKVRAKFTAEHTEEISQILETVKQGGDTAKAKEDLIQKATDRIAKTLSDTPSYDKLTKGKKGNEALALIRAHLKEAQRDFVPKLVELGAEPDLALQIDRMAKDNRRRIEVAANVLGIQRREKSIDNIANRIARQLSDTPDFKGGNAGNVDPARELIRQHLKTPQPDFVDNLVKLGATRKTAETIDRLSIENRKRILAVDHAQRVRALEKLYSRTGNTVAKRIPKPLWSKIVDLADNGLLTNDSFYDLVAKKLGLPSLDQAGRRDLARMAQEISKAPEGLPKEAASLKFSKYIARNLGFPTKDLPLGIYYGNMLSGYNTHIVNSLDTFLNVASEIQTMAAANPRSASRIAYGALHGYLTGRHDFMLALSRGRMVTEGKWLEQPRLMEVAEFGKAGGVPIREGTRFGRIAKAIGESKIAYPLNAWKYVSRLLSASDALNARAAEGARLALLNDRIARAEGLRGPALKARVDKLLGFTDEQMAAFRDQATQEGFTGSALGARVQELRRQAIREDARADAAEFAGIATYNHPPQGMLGYVARGMSNAADKYPILKLFVPFTNIVANVTNRGLNYTPLGYRRAFNLEFAKDADAKSAMLTRATLGTLGVGTLVAMQASGALQIHGNGPTDQDLRKQRMEGGWKPYSIQIGQNFFTYTYTPVGLFLSIIGNMTDAYRYKEMSQKDALTRGIFAVSRLGSTVFNQSFLSGLSNLFKGLSGAGGDVITAVRQTLSQSAGSLTTPSLIRDIQRWFDPQRYSSDTLQGDLLRNTPFAALVDRPVLNAFGEAIAPATNRFYSRISDDPAWQKVMKYDLKVPVPDKYTDMPDGKGGKRQITPEEYYKYQKMTGPIVKRLVMAMQFQNVPPDIGQKMLNEAAQTVRGAALEQLKLEALRHPAASP